MTQQLGMALIGAGRIGVSHAGLIAAHPGARLVAVVDAVPEAAETLAAKHEATNGTVTMTLEAVLEDPAIGAVLIATSTDTHADLIERAAKSGKAIFSEKPIDLSLERIDRCLGVVEATGATLMVGLNRRFDPGIAALKAKLDAGAIGQVSQISIINRDATAPPAAFLARSGGIFRDMALHDFDLACHLLGESPVSVTADGNALADAGAAEIGDYDASIAVLAMDGGARVVITNARCARFGFDFRLEVPGSDGVLSLGNAPLAGPDRDRSRPVSRCRATDFLRSVRNRLLPAVRRLSRHRGRRHAAEPHRRRWPPRLRHRRSDRGVGRLRPTDCIFRLTYKID